MKGKIHSIETFGTVDGPGIRYIVFFQGCPLKCKYCHNRDTWDLNGGIEKEASELVSDALKYKSFWSSNKGGGITLSGGEPTLQMDFLKEVLNLAKKESIHVALDTSGFIDLDRFKQIEDNIDLVLLDIKHIDNLAFKNLTGVENHKTLKLAKYLNEKNIPVWIRYVLVPGITDSKKDVSELAKFLSKLENIERIDILPYHVMGKFKWIEIEGAYPLEDVKEATKDDVLKAMETMISNGVSNDLFKI